MRLRYRTLLNSVPPYEDPEPVFNLNVFDGPDSVAGTSLIEETPVSASPSLAVFDGPDVDVGTNVE